MIEVHYTGKIGKAPELKGEGDKAYVMFGVATDKFVGEGKGDTDRNGKVTAYATTWMDTTAFGRTAQFICDRFCPGDTITVSGELDKKTYEKKDKEGNVIDKYAQSVRCLLRNFSGPFRAISKADSEAAKGTTGQTGEPAPARAAAPARASAAAAPAAAAPAGRAYGSRTPAPAARAAAPARVPEITDDDIPF